MLCVLFIPLSLTLATTQIDDFTLDFPNALSRSAALDSRIISAAQSTSSDYADIVSLAARQAMTIDFTVSRIQNGGFNTSDIKAFLRDTGSGSQQVFRIRYIFRTNFI